MTKRLLALLTMVALLAVVVAPTADAAYKWSKKKVIRVGKYRFTPRKDRKPVSWGDRSEAGKMDPRAAERRRQSLGQTALSPQTPEPPGMAVDSSYNDDLYFPSTPRLIDWRNTPIIHFAYSDKPTPAATPRYGYNFYDPIAGNWPRGNLLGCEAQAADDEGWYANLDLTPDGLVFLAGIDAQQFGAGNLDNNFYWLSPTNFLFCIWDNSVIPDSLYKPFLIDTTQQTQQPRVEIQEWLGDTIVHVIVIGEDPVPLSDIRGGDWGDLYLNPLMYFRKFGMAAPGVWQDGITIDSVNRSSSRQFINTGSITASRVSPKVAVAYTKYHQQAYAHVATHGSAQARYDVEIYRNVNDSIGEPSLWSGPINTTNYPRDVPSATAFIDAQGFYDSEGKLHIVWTAGLTVANPYDDPDYFWGDFSNGIYHWTERTGLISRVYNAHWGLEWNTQVCGFGDPGVGYVGQVSIGECDNKLYVIFTQWLDALGRDDWPVNDGIDQCTSVGERGFSAIGDIEMVVSSTLDGTLWDQARNITKTFTPDCDSATGVGGECRAEHLASIARYGMDVTSFGQTLTWPGIEDLDMTPAGDPPYAGNFYTHLMFLEDKLPAPGFRDTTQYNGLTKNALMWVRLACVDPVTAAQIDLAPSFTGYPDQTDHGVEKVITVTITNDGNTDLNILSTFIEKDTEAGTDWLGIQGMPASVPAGVPNTATFDVLINKGGVINNPGTLVALTGRVGIVSNAPSPRDTVYFEIENFIVGPVQDVVLDTVNTGRIALAVTSNGEVGDVGAGGVNMDFTLNGVDCDPNADIYLFDGSPLLVQAVSLNPGDSVLNLGTNLYVGGFGPSYAFKPVADKQLPNHFVGPDGSDAFFTGTFVNWDSSLALEQTYYAPTSAGNQDFIIVETRLFDLKNQSHPNLLFGDVMDWDVPNDSTAENVSGIAGDIVYLQGTDSTNDNVVPCTPPLPYKNRYAATGFLGMYTNAEYNADNCANNDNFHNSVAVRNDSTTLNAPNGAVDSAAVWNQLSVTGTWALPDTADLRAYTTYMYDFTLGAGETLTVYTVLTSVYNGSAADVEDNIKAACAWYEDFLRPGCSICGCCVGSAGNVNGDPGDIVDIADLTALIDNLFINFTPIPCPAEGNVNGDPGGVVDIADLTALIDHLFINFTPTAPCQ